MLGQSRFKNNGSWSADRLAAPTRLIAATCAVATLLICSPARRWGLVVALLVMAAVVLLFRPPSRVWRLSAALSASFFLPWLAVVPLLPRFDSDPGAPTNLEIAWGISFRGTLVVLTTLGAANCLSPSVLREGLLRLTVPKMVVSIVMQILQQASHMIEETRRTRYAIMLRHHDRGLHAGWLLAKGFPLMWLPRVFGRVERLAQVMELRGYHGEEEGLEPGPPLRAADYCVLVVCLVVVASACVSKHMGIT